MLNYFKIVIGRETHPFFFDDEYQDEMKASFDQVSAVAIATATETVARRQVPKVVVYRQTTPEMTPHVVGQEL